MPGVCPRRKIPDFLGPDLHPARPNNDVFPSASPSWLSSTPATTPFNSDRGARPPTFKGDSRKTSKKTQAHTTRARWRAPARTSQVSDRDLLEQGYGRSDSDRQAVHLVPRVGARVFMSVGARVFMSAEFS